MSQYVLPAFALALALFCAVPCAAEDETNEKEDVVEPFKLDDQFEKTHSFQFPSLRPIVFSVADMGGQIDGPKWRDLLEEKYGKSIALQSVANLSFLPESMYGAARMGIKATASFPVLCDYDGSVSAALGAKKDQANVIVVSATGKILHRTGTAPTKEKIEKVFETIDLAIEEAMERLRSYDANREEQ